jgi:hypothetical protein
MYLIKYLMKTKQKWIVLSFLFALIGIGGCDKDSADEQLPPIIDYPDDATFIEFNHVRVEKAQQLVQGKWRVYLSCGGFAGCQYLTGNYYQEFMGVNTLRITNPESTNEFYIDQWKITNHGCEVIYNNNSSSFVLEALRNDTLSCSNGLYGTNMSISFQAVKEK